MRLKSFLGEMILFNCFLSFKVKSGVLISVFLILLYHVVMVNEDPYCLPGDFKLKGMLSCHTLLACEDFKDIYIGKLLGFGAVKAVYHAKWKDFDVALSVLNDPHYEDDFLSGIKNIKEFQQNKFTIQAVGFCIEEKMYLTEFHKNGDASKLEEVLQVFPEVQNNALFRMGLCYNYAQILVSLHQPASADSTHILPRVLCDSNDLGKILSQLLLTDHLSLILNDMDALPTVVPGGIKCGHQELKGNFVAPEQVWHLPVKYDHRQMPGYDEKTDIWKSPSVCDHFLSGVRDGESVKRLLMPIHEKCKNVIPKDRPTANELLEFYAMIKDNLDLGILDE